MKLIHIFAMILILGISAAANDAVLPGSQDLVVHNYPVKPAAHHRFSIFSPGAMQPYVITGLHINTGGYQPVSESLGAGVLLETSRVLADAQGFYDNARKVNDATTDNHAGHERHLSARGFYAVHRLYIGGGYQWSQLTTTNYAKTGARPVVGAVKDWEAARLSALYVFTGNDTVNGSHGVEASVTFPSPKSSSHVLFRDTIEIYRFHDTVTAPEYAYFEAANHHFTGSNTLSLIFRLKAGTR